MKFGNNYLLWMGALFIFLIDQITKILALNFLNFDEEFIMNKTISLHRIYNESYVMLDYNVYDFLLTPVQFKIIYGIISLVLMFGIIWVTNQPALKENSWPAEFSKTGLFLILGGILGNAFDRIFRNDGVIDFIRVNYYENSVPIMNIADIIIYFGEICLIIAWLLIFTELTFKKFLKIKHKV